MNAPYLYFAYIDIETKKVVIDCEYRLVDLVGMLYIVYLSERVA